jgi:hypothetical protein
MTNDEPDALDRVLDKALAEYSREEPLSGLEQRVLNRVRAEGSVRRVAFGRWVLACGIAAVAVIILTTVLWKRPLPPGPGPGLAAQAEPSRLAQPQPPAPSPQARRARFASGQARRTVPLTREERALLAVVTRAPNQALEAFNDLQRRSAEPIEFDEIKIEPLRSDHAKDDTK